MVIRMNTMMIAFAGMWLSMAGLVVLGKYETLVVVDSILILYLMWTISDMHGHFTFHIMVLHDRLLKLEKNTNGGV
jgi:hypothetical protein